MAKHGAMGSAFSVWWAYKFEVLDAIPPGQRLRLPMRPRNRSLNLSNAVAVVVFEAWRQRGFDGGA